MNARYLTLDGKPWLPVMGEMHYSRVPEAEWEEEILKMKSAGVQVIATYIIWIHHEEEEGQWDWSGQKDLRHFVELCAKHGMYVVPRVGPWSHAEVRNGGFPDWLVARVGKNERSNDPEYVKAVDLYFKQIGEQLNGLMWDQGGPVVAVQLENEYNRRGPGRGNDHILKLKQMVRDAGLKVPFYTVTGWDGAAIPHGEVLPVYGGYPDAPWDASIGKLKPNEVYAFRFGSRVTGDMGAISGGAPTGNAANFTTDTPFMTAEMGGGMQVTYHRRPVVSADDIAAMVPVMLGSGVNLYGTYMFQGGENPDGKLTTLQESLATHYANDLPVKTYDFEAPLGEFGDERESLLKLKSWNYFMNDFGFELAPMDPHKPDTMPRGPSDLAVARISARTSGESGFLFVNNHVRGAVMPARPGFQVQIRLPGGASVRVPEMPINLPADSYFVWPFGMNLGGVHLRYATAQPLALLGTEAAPAYAFFAQPGIRPEFVFQDSAGLKVTASGKVERRDSAVRVSGLEAGPNARITLALPTGRKVTILLLDEQDAEHAWKIASGGAKELLLTPQQAFVDGDVATLENLGAATFAARVLPQGIVSSIDPAPLKLSRSGDSASATLAATGPAAVRLALKQEKAPGEPAALPEGFKPSGRPRVVAAAPAEADWVRAGVWSFTVPPPVAPTRTRQFLRIRYQGDVARLSVGGKLLDDNFFDLRPWLVGLDRFAGQIVGKPLQLAIYPLRKNPPIFFQPGLEPKNDAPGAEIESVELVTQYRLRLQVRAPSKAAR